MLGREVEEGEKLGLVFTDVRVPAENIVGQRGEGWKIANTTLSRRAS